jgi:hypothetical protein
MDSVSEETFQEAFLYPMKDEATSSTGELKVDVKRISYSALRASAGIRFGLPLPQQIFSTSLVAQD